MLKARFVSSLSRYNYSQELAISRSPEPIYFDPLFHILLL